MVVDKSLGSVSTGGVGAIPTSAPSVSNVETNSKAPGFGEILNTKLYSPNAGPAAQCNINGIKFSQHALDRMAMRGITFKPEDLARLNDAVEKAAKKGSRESLVLMGDNALIVSIKNKTVVTTLDREAMKENVFTNIDSTVIL